MRLSSSSSEAKPFFTGSFSEKEARTCGQKCLIYLLIILFIAATVFMALFLVYFFKYEDRDTNDICDTVNCVKTAAMLAEKMDQSVNPCEDFDKYACGNFYQTVVLEDGETRKNSFSLVSDRNNDFLK
ncbi:hypothetical protein RRG08_067363, partial [Elysia crispata]